MTTDSLRENIREIVWRELEYEGDDFCGHIADVLIRELELSIEHHKTYTGGDLRYLTIEGHFNEPI